MTARALLPLVALLLIGGCLEAAEPLRVMTFNIRYASARDGENAWPKRKHTVAKAIGRFNPDILGLQEAEASQLDYLTKQLPGYTLLGQGRTDGKRKGEFAALMLRTQRIESHESGTIWLSDTPDKPGSLTWDGKLPRVYTWAKASDRETGRGFYLINTHWDHQSQESRNKSALAILRHASQNADDKTPVVVMGDLNAGPKNSALRRLIHPETGLRDAFALANPNTKRIGTFNRFRGNASGAQIDWVLVSHHWKVNAAGVVQDKWDGRYPSDHFPVWAKLSLKPE